MQSNTVASLREAIGRSVSSLFGLFTALVGTAVVVGVASAATIMASAVLQRRREIAVLRAQGMTRGNICSLLVVEGALLGFTAAATSVLLGGFLTWGLIGVMRRTDFDPAFVYSIPLALGVLFAGVAVAVLAAIYPALMAGRTSIVATLGTSPRGS